MKLSTKLALSAIAGFAFPTALYAQTALPAPVTAQLEAARQIAGTLYAPVQQHLCYLHSPEDEARLTVRRANAPLRPTRVFDNLYYVGVEDVAAWALTTSDGIILFDSLDNPSEAQTNIIGGLRTLGLDPMKIKYVVITHGHGDHFGGAQYLKNATGAHLLASQVDWGTMENSRTRGPVAWRTLVPDQDQIIADGETLTLGDTKVTFHLTPGHTPGTVSSIFQVKDHGIPHVLAFWGGIGVPNSAAPLAQYIQSDDRFRKIADDAGADVAISNHPHADMTLEWVYRIHNAAPGTPNPLVVGKQNVDRWFDVIKACALAQQSRLEAGIAPQRRQPRGTPSAK